jgi:hypothetical protein
MLSPKTPASLATLEDEVDDHADLTYKGESGGDNDRDGFTIPRKLSELWTTLGPLVLDLVVGCQMDDLLTRPPPEDIDVPFLLKKHDIKRSSRGMLWIAILERLTNEESLFQGTCYWYYSTVGPEPKASRCQLRAYNSIQLQYREIGPYLEDRDPNWNHRTPGLIEVDLSGMACSCCGQVRERNEHKADMNAISRLSSTSDDRYRRCPYRISIVPYNDDSFRLRLISYVKSTLEGKVVGKSKRYDIRNDVGLVVLQQVINDSHSLFCERPIECMALYVPDLI